MSISHSTAREALSWIDSSDRDTWVRMAMALKAEFGDEAHEIWDEWSRRAANYQENSARAVWRSVKAYGGVGIGSLIALAKEVGWTPRAGQVAEPTREQIAERKRKEAAERVAEARKAEAARRAMMAAWNAAKPLRNGHPYLERKKVEVRGAGHALRVAPDGSLMIPMLDQHGGMLSYQAIHDDGTKLFAPGCSAAGAMLMIDRTHAILTIYCEGYATGMTLWQAIANARVIVCFSDHGLVAAAKRPCSGLRVVCADNDVETAERIGRNPGMLAGLAAADLLGCGVAYPSGIVGTDWNDWLCERFAERADRMSRRETDAQIMRTLRAEMEMMIMREAKL